MRAVKLSMAVTVSGFVIAGLMLSAMCSLQCALNSHAPQAVIKPAKQAKQSSTCHQSSASHEQSSSDEQSPSSRHSDDQSGCPCNAEMVALRPGSALASVALYHFAQPIATEIPSTAKLDFDTKTAMRAEGTIFRSPPKLSEISVLRI